MNFLSPYAAGNILGTLYRACLLYGISYLIIVGWEYCYIKFYKHSQPPIYLGFFLAVCAVVFYVSSFWLGAVVTVYAIGLSYLEVLMIGALFFAWASTIALQIGQNAVRHLLKERVQPIRWIKKGGVRKRKRK